MPNSKWALVWALSIQSRKTLGPLFSHPVSNRIGQGPLHNLFGPEWFWSSVSLWPNNFCQQRQGVGIVRLFESRPARRLAGLTALPYSLRSGLGCRADFQNMAFYIEGQIQVWSIKFELLSPLNLSTAVSLHVWAISCCKNAYKRILTICVSFSCNFGVQSAWEDQTCSLFVFSTSQ